MGRPRVYDLKGKRFGYLEALEPVRNGWLVRCYACGRVKKESTNNLVTGVSKSCGCKRSEFCRQNATVHGMCGSYTWQSWRAMMNRCYNPNQKKYATYGARGIIVCKKWHKFEGFFEDMGIRPSGKTLDRKDNSKGYYKSNCRWATAKQQRHNQGVKT